MKSSNGYVSKPPPGAFSDWSDRVTLIVARGPPVVKSGVKGFSKIFIKKGVNSHEQLS